MTWIMDGGGVGGGVTQVVESLDGGVVELLWGVWEYLLITWYTYEVVASITTI